MAAIAIVGVGAIGSVMAAALQQAGGHRLTLCTRRPLEGLRVETPDGEVKVDAENITDPQHGRPADWVIITTKTYDAAGAAAWLPQLLGPQTRVAIIQNGVEHRERFASYVAAERIVPVVIDTPAERRPDGSVLQRGPARMHVAEADQAFAGLFTADAVALTPDFLTAAWRKLCLNSAGVLSALTLKPAGVLNEEEIGLAALDLIAECVAVGRAAGAQLEDGMGEKVLAGYRAGSPDSVNSILADRLARRQTEIDARNGVIVRLGRQHGIPTPANGLAVALMKHTGTP